MSFDKTENPIQQIHGRLQAQQLSAPPDPWALWQRQLHAAQAEIVPPEPEIRPLRFVLRTRGFDLLVQPLRGKIGKLGGLTGLKSLRVDPKRIIERSFDDDPLDRGLLLALSGADYLDDAEGVRWYLLPGRANRALEAVLAAGHVHWLRATGPVLTLAAARPLQLAWRVAPDGNQQLMPEVAGAIAEVAGESWSWYIEPDSARIGPVAAGALKPMIAVLQYAPAVTPEQLPSLPERLARLTLPIKLPAVIPLQLEVQNLRPVAVLRLHQHAHDHVPAKALSAVLVEPFLRYGKRLIPLNPSNFELREYDGKSVRRYPRDPDYDARLRSFLQRQDFHPGAYWQEDPAQARMWKRPKPLPTPELIQRWAKSFIEAATQAGYQIEAGPGFPLETRPVIEHIALEVRDPEAGNAWFETRLGIEVDGQQIDLAPLLVSALAEPFWVEDFLRLRLEDGRELLIARARLAPLLAVLSEMELRADGRMSVPRTRLHTFEVPADLRLVLGSAAAKLRHELQNFAGLQPVPLPASFLGTLRPYQQQGVSWLQFLRELKFGGILADDMGLGKTVQVLAHLTVEQAAGRLADPALVVCPTSVVGNWEAEVARFAPSLKLVVFHGQDRAAKAGELADADLVITSYALLARDAAIMAKQHFSWAIFDEAQWLKNNTSKSFAAAAKLQAGQRLCMTGTPVENHLGELKTQFDLAFPGLLGSTKDFQQRFRVPIEKEHDIQTATQLKRRLAPFLLRRRKTEVATELPPRSTLIQRIELAGPQRDLYESIRVQMETRVRAALAERGLASSSITILDALLKLRQVCCHPHLLQQESAKKVSGAAKLEALCELLPTLVEDGRSILLFSQFTSMLDLIEPELRSRQINFVRLDGSTRDRTTPVNTFQAGSVPVFLISLKAGGVGLNLTRADTVILYDPWWNPAVEQQAIDRAHRIGQDKPVFVYELSCINTVEDKMQKLKERKRVIAEAVLNEGEAALSRLTGAELLELFAG